jgi:hypothetical protein
MQLTTWVGYPAERQVRLTSAFYSSDRWGRNRICLGKTLGVPDNQRSCWHEVNIHEGGIRSKL